MHLTILQARDRKQVFHRGIEPHGIGADIAQKPFALLGTQVLAIRQEHIGIARNCRKGRSQVVRDRPEQVGTQLLIFSQNGSLFALLKRPCTGKGKRCLSRNGLGLVALRGKRGCAHKADAHDAHDIGARAQGQVQAGCRRKKLRPNADALAVLQGPSCHRELDYRRGWRCAGRGEAPLLQEALPLIAVPHNRCVKEPRQLGARRAHDLAARLAATKGLVCLQHDLGPAVRRVRSVQLSPQCHGNRARNKGDRKHHGKGSRIRAPPGRQRKARRGEKVVIQERRKRRCDKAVRTLYRKERYAKNRKHIGNDDARLHIKGKEGKTHQRGRHQKQEYAGKIDRIALWRGIVGPSENLAFEPRSTQTVPPAAIQPLAPFQHPRVPPVSSVSFASILQPNAQKHRNETIDRQGAAHAKAEARSRPHGFSQYEIKGPRT